MRFFNHEWDKPETFASIGRITADEIEQISGGLFREEVDVRLNKLIFDYDRFLILGPVFPHEVVGFSGGNKYLFPGIAGDEIINFFHWLGAVITNPVINGVKWTPYAQGGREGRLADRCPARPGPIVVGRRQGCTGLFLGDPGRPGRRRRTSPPSVHIIYKDRPYHSGPRPVPRRCTTTSGSPARSCTSSSPSSPTAAS